MNNLSLWKPLRRTGNLAGWRRFAAGGPWRQLDAVGQRMSKLFRQWPAVADTRESLAAVDWSPAVDISEDKKEYLVKVELPEVKKDDVKVTVEDGTLSITGERKSEKEETGKKFHRLERYRGRFERAFALPADADAKRVTSKYENGVLEVHIAKEAKGKPKAVEVKIQQPRRAGPSGNDGSTTAGRERKSDDRNRTTI